MKFLKLGRRFGIWNLICGWIPGAQIFLFVVRVAAASQYFIYKKRNVPPPRVPLFYFSIHSPSSFWRCWPALQELLILQYGFTGACFPYPGCLLSETILKIKDIARVLRSTVFDKENISWLSRMSPLLVFPLGLSQACGSYCNQCILL